MKKFLYTIFISAFAVFFIACAKVDEGAVNFTSETGLAITGSIVNFDDTRLSYSLDGNVLKSSWEVGDRIFGFDNTGATFTFEVESIETNKAKFKIVVPPASDAETLYAIYYPGKTSFDFEKEGNSLKLSVDVSSQSGKLDGTTPAIMCATGNIEGNSVSFEFANQTAIVGVKKMQIRTNEANPVEDKTRITGVTLNNVATTGTIKKKQIENKNVLVLEADTDLHAISATGLKLETITEGDTKGIINVDPDAPAPYFAVIPTTNAPISVTATDGTNTTYHNLAKISSTDLAAGSYYYLGKKLDKIVAICDGEGYTDLTEAFNYAKTTDKDVTIKMYDDVELSEQIIFTQNKSHKITLDLNGFEIDGTNVSVLFFGETSFEVKDDNEPSKQGSIKAKNCAIHLKPKSSGQTLTINGGKIEADGYLKDGTGVVFFQNNSQNSCRLYVQGGEINCNCTNENGRAVNVNCSSTLSGGKITSSGYGWRCYGGKTTIDGTAEIITEGEKSPIVVYDDTNIDFKNGFAKADGNVSIVGKEGTNQSGTVNITGGHFNKEVTSADGLADGYICYEKGEPKGYEWVVESEAGEALFEYTKDGQTYKTNAKLVDAITMANDYNGECTITMLDNYTFVSKQTITNTNGVTLDLNGKTITHDGTKRLGTDENGYLIITDSSNDGKIVQKTTGSNTISIKSGKVKITKGTITQDDGATVAAVVVSEEASFVVEGGKIISNASNNDAIQFSGTGDLTISGGVVEATGSETNSNAVQFNSSGTLSISENASVKNGKRTLYFSNGTVKISGGEISNNNGVAIYSYGNSNKCALEITSGVITSLTSNAIYCTSESANISTVSVKGGKFKSGGSGGVISKSNASTTTISVEGGYFNKEVSENFLASQCECCKTKLEEDYPWQVVNYGENKALVIGASSTTYEMKATINDAVDCANQNGGKIILVSNCQVQGTSAKNISYTNGVTLDLNGKTLTQNGLARIGVNGGTLNIEDNKTEGMITQKAPTGYYTLSIASGTLNVYGGTISGPSNALSMLTNDVANCNIYGGNIIGTSSFAVININNSNATVTIKGNNVSVKKNYSSSQDATSAVVNLSAGTLKLEQGTIGGNDGGNTTALRIGSGEFTMTGGSLLAKYHAIVFNGTTTGKQSTISGGDVKNFTDNAVIRFDSDEAKNSLTVFGNSQIYSAGALFSTGENEYSLPSGALSIQGGQFNKIPYYVTGEYGVAQTIDQNYPYSVVSGPEAKFTKGNLSTNFKDIDFALNQVSSSCTVQLLSGCTLSESFTLNDVNNKLTLNLNGKTLSANSNSLNVSAGTLTIQDGTGTSGQIEASGTALNVTGGTTKIQGGIIKSTSTSKDVSTININGTNAEVEISGGQVILPDLTNTYSATPVIEVENGSLTLKDNGTIGGTDAATGDYTAVRLNNSSSFTMSGGTVIAKRHAIIFASMNSTATLSGGELKNTATDSNNNLIRFNNTGFTGTVIIKNNVRMGAANDEYMFGTSRNTAITSKINSVIISGGYFNVNVKEKYDTKITISGQCSEDDTYPNYQYHVTSN